MTPAQLALFAPPPIRQPVAWVEPDTLPVAFRACWRCDHGVDEHGTRRCANPELLRDGRAVDLMAVRGWGGGCGPDADKLKDPRIT